MTEARHRANGRSILMALLACGVIATLAGCADDLPVAVVGLQARVDAVLPPKTDEELQDELEAAEKEVSIEVPPEFPPYVPTRAGVSGTIVSIGSDTMNNMMALWANGFQRFHQSVLVEVEGKGSSTAPTALIEGRANFGPMSRPMKAEEEDEFEAEFGYKPTALRTSIDMLAVYVHKDNPVRRMTLEEVDAIFSRNRKRGFANDVLTWGGVGLTGRWERKRISAYGRNSASGTYGFFKEVALRKGDYKGSVKEQPGSSSVVQGVANDIAGIGYSGIGYRTADVRALSLAARKGRRYVPPTPEHAYSGDYPLARYLYLYINKKPNTELDPMNAEFIRYVFSRDGQKAVVKDGYYPVSAAMARSTLVSLGLEED